MTTILPQADHLLLLSDKSHPSRSLGPNFFERDWSQAWANFLLQEVGCYDAFAIEDFDFQNLNSYRFVYLPSSLASRLGSKHSNLFKSFVESGGTLILEGPVANFIHSSGVRLSSKKKILKTITRVGEKTYPHPLVESLQQMAFETWGWETESQASDIEVILEMEKLPVLFMRQLGTGRIVTLGFDFGLLLMGLQQGVPVNGEYCLRKLFGTQHRVVEPEDLLLKASFLDSPTPHADLFERFLFKVITSNKPVPRWWYFPNPYTGAVISTHDDEAIGADPRMEEMLVKEKAAGIRGTLFVIADEGLHKRWGSNGRLRRLNEEEAEIGLHWNRFQKPRLRVRSFKFGMHEKPLGRQVAFLERELGRPIRLNRTHYLALGHSYDEHFKSLQAQGLFFDSTYGPNQNGKGYLFGTGYPYEGVTWNGSPSGVLELPFLTQEMWGGADLDFLKRLIRESDENFHQCVVMNFHPHYSIRHEEGHQTWLGSLRFAQERKQWIPTLGEFFEFFEQRKRSVLQSQFLDNILKISAESQAEASALSFPDRISGGRRFLRAEIDGIEASPKRILNSWFEEMLVPVSKGLHRILVVYEK